MNRWVRETRGVPIARLRNGLVWTVGALSAAMATTLGALLALVFAATVVVIALIASVVIAFAGLAMRARRTAQAAPDGSALLEARNIGGHSWVAYGWDTRR